MIVQLEEEKWIVEWEHYQNIKTKKLTDESCDMVERTDCTVKKFNDDDSISTLRTLGFAECSNKDQFNKNTGRKVSMKRAIQFFNKLDRRKFWEAYAEMRNGNF